jgi:hypothetical protein
MTLWQYVKTGSDPAATAVMMEDGAAVGAVDSGVCSGNCSLLPGEWGSLLLLILLCNGRMLSCCQNRHCD